MTQPDKSRTLIPVTRIELDARALLANLLGLGDAGPYDPARLALFALLGVALGFLGSCVLYAVTHATVGVGPCTHRSQLELLHKMVPELREGTEEPQPEAVQQRPPIIPDMSKPPTPLPNYTSPLVVPRR